MEQEPQRELEEWYTLRRVAHWVRVGGRLLFVFVAVGIIISTMTTLIIKIL